MGPAPVLKKNKGGRPLGRLISAISWFYVSCDRARTWKAPYRRSRWMTFSFYSLADALLDAFESFGVIVILSAELIVSARKS